ncbi:MAG: response regulator transcription factor [Actinomycetota bacterium]|nr:response regulator transcription factor [Actinomycetota bacterium]
MLGTILVVDDNAKIVEVLEAYLRKEGFEVLTATDGEEAELIAEQQHVDLALLDVMLPGIDGIELTKRFQRRWDTPVILVTARTDEIDRLIGLEVGADDYVSKPFSPREVVARVRAVLRRMDRSSANKEDSARLAVGDLVLDSGRRTAEVEGSQLELTRTEFDLMWAMAAHPGRVYSRMQLLEIASGDSFDGYERTIDAHVKNLRRKIGDDPRAPKYIRTVFGVGYKIEIDR